MTEEGLDISLVSGPVTDLLAGRSRRRFLRHEVYQKADTHEDGVGHGWLNLRPLIRYKT